MQSKTSPQLSILRQWIVRLAFIEVQVPNWKAGFSLERITFWMLGDLRAGARWRRWI